MVQNWLSSNYPERLMCFMCFRKQSSPIDDSNTQAGIYFLTQGRYGSHRIVKTKSKDPVWYLETFCNIVATFRKPAQLGTFRRNERSTRLSSRTGRLATETDRT